MLGSPSKTSGRIVVKQDVGLAPLSRSLETTKSTKATKKTVRAIVVAFPIAFVFQFSAGETKHASLASCPNTFEAVSSTKAMSGKDGMCSV